MSNTATATASPTPVPVATPVQVPSSNVFSTSMIGQTWYYADAVGHRLKIIIESAPCAFGICDSNIVVWHYKKPPGSCEGYWNPRTRAQCAVAVALDELWFVLHLDRDGAWRCIGFNYVDYLGIKWKVQILTPPGKAAPYTIIPASPDSIGVATSYNAVVQQNMPGDSTTDFSVPPGAFNFESPWLTEAGSAQYTSNYVGTVTTLTSRQHEGCTDELATFVPSVGLVNIAQVFGVGDNGACIAKDPSLVMVRVSDAF